MTQEEKQLLLVDLCARLPYHVRVKVWLKDGTTEEGFYDFEHNYEDVMKDFFFYNKLNDLKPYLRPMSSMTEEEIVEINSMGFAYWTTMINNDLRTRGPMSLLDAIITHHKMVKLTDWLNAHHFDFRNLIERGLAIDCTGLSVY